MQRTQLTRWPKIRGKRNDKRDYQVMKAIMYMMVPTCEHESLICVVLLLVNVCIIGYIQLCITNSNILRCQGPNVFKMCKNNEQLVPYCGLTRKWQLVGYFREIIAASKFIQPSTTLWYLYPPPLGLQTITVHTQHEFQTFILWCYETPGPHRSIF